MLCFYRSLGRVVLYFHLHFSYITRYRVLCLRVCMAWRRNIPHHCSCGLNGITAGLTAQWTTGKAGGDRGMADAMAPVLLPTRGRRDTPGKSRAYTGSFPLAFSPDSVSILHLWAARGGLQLRSCLRRRISPFHQEHHPLALPHGATAVFEKEDGRSHQHPFSPMAICTSICSPLWGEFRKKHICT